MTRYYYDFEFIEDGRTIDLISIGVVADDGREYYAVNADVDQDRIFSHPWLKDNVWPYLPTQTVPMGQFARGLWVRLDQEHPDVKHPEVIANEVRDFLLAGPTEPELWAWYAAYDHVALMQLWGPMMARPERIPMWTNDIRQEQHRLGVQNMPGQQAKEHHALDDARHNKVMHEWLIHIEQTRRALRA